MSVLKIVKYDFQIVYYIFFVRNSVVQVPWHGSQHTQQKKPNIHDISLVCIWNWTAARIVW